MAHTMASSTGSSTDDGTRLRAAHHSPAWMPSLPLPPAAPVGVIGDRGGSAVTLKPLEPAPLVPQPLPLPVLQLSETVKPRPRKRRMCRGDASSSASVPKMTAIATEPALCKPLIAVAHTPSANMRVASATATATLSTFSEKGGENDTEGTIRARVQRLLVQCVLLPVVWVSLCCVITAVMGIECVETLQKALTYEQEDAREDMNDRPTKKAKRSLRDSDELRLKQAFQKAPQPTEDTTAKALIHKKRKAKTNGYVDDGDDEEAKARVRVRSVSHALAATTRQTRPRRRRVLIWDLDETLVLFASLYSGQFARTHEKELATSVALGEQMMTYLVAVLERHFYFSDLHDADIDHITCVQDTAAVDGSETPVEQITKGSPSYAKVVADRYARIRAIYERRDAVDFLDEPTSQWFAARQGLVASIDAFSTGWIREARELLELTSSQRRVETGGEQGGEGEEEVINVMVTNTQLSPALCKCMIYGLDAYFPIDAVYSSSKLHKLKCFQTIISKYSNQTAGESSSPSTTNDEVEFIAIGDGAEEEHVSHALGLSFFKIRSLADLKQLRYELQLAQRPQPNEDPQATGTTDATLAQQ